MTLRARTFQSPQVALHCCSPGREISTPAIADRIAQARDVLRSKSPCLRLEAVLSRYDELPGRGKPQGITAKQLSEKQPVVLLLPKYSKGRHRNFAVSRGSTWFHRVIVGGNLQATRADPTRRVRVPFFGWIGAVSRECQKR